MTIRVFELYSGIGGMHFALKECELDAEVIRAIDINTTANSVYKENFPMTTLLEKNIQGLTKDDFNKLKIDMILMSPPCQPHTRNGLKRDKGDPRSNSLLYIFTLIPDLKTVKFIFLENVKGFETSETRIDLLNVLKESGYTFQEFLLTPTQFSIPNSRLRYYLLAKKKPLKFCFDINSAVLEEIPKLKSDVDLTLAKLNLKYKKLCLNNSCFEIGLLLEKSSRTMIPDKILKKYGTLFDIITEKSVNSCCFTKGYGHFVEGTGSVLSVKKADEISLVFMELKSPEKCESFLNLLKSLELQYLTPSEISKLMCFPDNFVFPKFLTDKQKYRLLGNSINVHVVSLLIKILVS